MTIGMRLSRAFGVSRPRFDPLGRLQRMDAEAQLHERYHDRPEGLKELFLLPVVVSEDVVEICAALAV